MQIFASIIIFSSSFQTYLHAESGSNLLQCGEGRITLPTLYCYDGVYAYLSKVSKRLLIDAQLFTTVLYGISYLLHYTLSIYISAFRILRYNNIL